MPSAAVVLQPREVPLGGHRAITVRRTLPHRDRAFVGAWCFADHYGPANTAMDVAPHPHTGLQTVSWLFEGTIEHRDALGTHEMVRPGELNLMTAGRGICHSEVSTADSPRLHGVQLWVALPNSSRNSEPAFDHHVPESIEIGLGASAKVLLGELPGIDSSPVATHTPLLGAELTLNTGCEITLDLDPSHEHAVLVDGGDVRLGDTSIGHGEMAILTTGRHQLTLEANRQKARVMLLGGVPFDEAVVMWWNFLGRSHDEIEAFAAEWNAHDERFGQVEGYNSPTGGLDRIPAPQMPPGRLLPTVKRGRRSSLD